MESIIQTEKECFVCKTTRDLHCHHVFYGTSNRKNSEAHGMKVWLCGYHHNMSNAGVHFDKSLDTRLKQVAQETFEKTHTRDEFRSIFGKSYL